MPAVELQHGFVAALIGIVNDRDGLLPDGVPSAVDAGDQEEATRYAFPLRGHFDDLAIAVPGLNGL